MMSVSDDKSQTIPAQKKRTLRRTRVLQVQTHPRLRKAARRSPAHPLVIAGARGRNRFLKLIGIIGTRFSGRKKGDKPGARAGRQ
jgi:hypothetical protein